MSALALPVHCPACMDTGVKLSGCHCHRGRALAALLDWLGTPNDDRIVIQLYVNRQP